CAACAFTSNRSTRRRSHRCHRDRTTARTRSRAHRATSRVARRAGRGRRLWLSAVPPGLLSAALRAVFAERAPGDGPIARALHTARYRRLRARAGLRPPPSRAPAPSAHRQRIEFGETAAPVYRGSGEGPALLPASPCPVRA